MIVNVNSVNKSIGNPKTVPTVVANCFYTPPSTEEFEFFEDICASMQADFDIDDIKYMYTSWSEGFITNLHRNNWNLYHPDNRLPFQLVLWYSSIGVTSSKKETL